MPSMFDTSESSTLTQQQLDLIAKRREEAAVMRQMAWFDTQQRKVDQVRALRKRINRALHALDKLHRSIEDINDPNQVVGIWNGSVDEINTAICGVNLGRVPKLDDFE